jgi:hypothetical protein
MRVETIIEIAEDRIVGELCVKYYYETDPIKKQELFDQIQEWYKKINQK